MLFGVDFNNGEVCIGFHCSSQLALCSRCLTVKTSQGKCLTFNFRGVCFGFIFTCLCQPVVGLLFLGVSLEKQANS